jgi:hypothetical protein
LPPLLPTPKQVRALDGAFALRNGLPIALEPGSTDSDLLTACALKEAVLQNSGIRLAIETHARTNGIGPRIELHRKGEQGEAYRLGVDPELVDVEAKGAAGLRYGVETLIQLVGNQGRVPACRVEDEPDLALRGILIDISRGKVPTLETLRQVVDLCVRLKLNALMLYTEHTFRYRRHPEIGAEAWPLDAATIRELDAHAAANHVDLIPTLQSLGHMRRILEIPRYRHLAETDRLWTISPAEPGTYQLIQDLYDEYLPNFRSRFFNANCDEPVDLGDGKSLERSRHLGPGGVYLEHVRRIREMARAHGKRTMIWGDVVHAHPERIAELDRDLVLLDWWYEAQHDFDRVKVFSDHGIEFLVCPGTSSWNALFPRLDNSLANIAGYAAAGKRHRAWGLITTDWGDGGHYNLLGNSWFGFGWGAQQAWAGDAPPQVFDRAFSRVLFGDASGKTARSYRALGAIHDGGFSVFNASPLQRLYFDDLGTAEFIIRAKRPALNRTLKRLRRVRDALNGQRDLFVREKLTHQELLLAADASVLATEKAIAGLEYSAWRKRPKHLDAAGRRRLSRTLARLAARQTELGRRLQKLWLTRNQPSNFEITADRLRISIRSLRRASRKLKDNRPPPTDNRRSGR